MAKFITPSAVLFLLMLIMLVACGQNIDAGRNATAIASGIGSFLCLVAACAKDGTA